MNKQAVLITGTSSGLGLAMAEHYLSTGAEVYGLSRSGSPVEHESLHDAKVDLADLDKVQSHIDDLLEGVDHLDTVILNAGILGGIEPMSSLDMRELNKLMDINVWSNKLLLDNLCERKIKIDHVVAISSGAAVNGNKGWGAYSLSKATLNMLVKLYAAEYENIYFTALAPGLVDTKMQDYLCNNATVDGDAFPSVKNLRAARGTDAMPTPEVAARTIIRLLPSIQARFDSGEFVDIRNL